MAFGMTVNAFNPLIRPGLRDNFGDEFTDWKEQYSQFLKTGKTDKPEVMATIMTGTNRLFERGDMEPVSYSTPKIGPRVAGVDKEFAGGVAIGRKIVEDDQYGKANQAGKWLANAYKQTVEYRGAAFLDDAFTGTVYKGIDGLKLISNAHTYLNATGTWSNYVGASQLSMTAVTSMIELANLTKNHDGDPTMMMFDKVVIGNNPGDRFMANKIFKQMAEPLTSNRDDNQIKQDVGNVTIITSAYKTSTRSWFGIDSKRNDAEFLIRRAPKLEDSFDFNTDAALFKLSCRILIWFVEPRGWWGADPT